VKRRIDYESDHVLPCDIEAAFRKTEKWMSQHKYETDKILMKRYGAIGEREKKETP
jgi:hypothetical protein